MPHKDPEARRAYDRAYNTTHRSDRNAWSHAHPGARLVRDARTRAKRYGVPCTLTLADVRALLAPMRCSATGLPLTHNTGGGYFHALSPSLDRLTSARGYVPGNVRLVCHRFNQLRRQDPISQDFRHALRVLAETDHEGDRIGH